MSDNPVRVIEVFVNSLDMQELGFQMANPNINGRPAYDPHDLLKLYLYGYMNRIRSSIMDAKEYAEQKNITFILTVVKGGT